MRKTLAVLVLSSACLFCVQAKAGIVALGDGVLNAPAAVPPSTAQIIYDFNSASLGAANFSDANATFASTGGASVVVNSLAGQYAAPYFGPGQPGQDATQYLSVFGGSSEKITLASNLVGNVFGLYIGSLDTYNSIQFFNGSTAGTLITGSDIVTATGMSTALSNQNNYNSNRFVEFSGFGPFTSVVLKSDSNSFEVDNVTFDVTSSNSLTPGVPEPSTWAMMILGFLSVGFVAYRRKPKSLELRLV
jgi:hypothetical protein